jgi:hypothetical protein
MRPFQVLRTFVVDSTGQPICYCREETTAERIAYALNELERQAADARPPEAKLFVRPEPLRAATLEWPKVSMLEDENAGERWLDENAEGIREYNTRIEQGLFYARQAEDERLASLKEPDAADELRAVFDAPAQMQSKVKKEGGAEYFDVVVIARSPKTDIWLAHEGHLVQKSEGTLVTRILPGHYTVEFGLGSPTYPLQVTTDVRWTEEEITADPPCARPIPHVPSADSEL